MSAAGQVIGAHWPITRLRVRNRVGVPDPWSLVATPCIIANLAGMSETPTPQEVRRALARAERGAALDLPEATALLAATGEELDRLCAAAAKVRDAGLVAAGRPATITYSPKVF